MTSDTGQTHETTPVLYCNNPPQIIPALPDGLAVDRLRAIILGHARWVNGTTLHYNFFDGPEPQRQVVRDAFAEWIRVGIGIKFLEVGAPSEAEARIGFLSGDGSWSYVGRDSLTIGTQDRTMNFGWDLTNPYGRTTALHEIGHLLGLPHEHQNPNAGIVWDEPAVYQYLGGPPNNWDHDTTYQNVLRKLNPLEVEGSDWDPDSIMEYEFPPGLVSQPEKYRALGITPPGTISQMDRAETLKWYPAMDDSQLTVLEPFKSISMSLAQQQQVDFRIEPNASREYKIGTFGDADAVAVLFEDVSGEMRYLAGDDDSGSDANALITQKLFAGRKYIVRVRLYYSWSSGDTAVMYW